MYVIIAGCIDLTETVDDDFVDLTSSQRDGANDTSVVVSYSYSVQNHA